MKSYDKFIGGTFVVISVNAAASRYENIADSREIIVICIVNKNKLMTSFCKAISFWRRTFIRFYFSDTGITAARLKLKSIEIFKPPAS